VNARFFAPDAASEGDIVTLPAEEAQHLTRVLRLSSGDEVRVFNGRGREFDAVIEQASKSTVQVRVGRARDAAAEAGIALTLAQAVLKGDRMDDVIRDAVMVGVAAIQPVVTARTEVAAGALDRGTRVQRWERIAVSSAKQCGRAIVPPVRRPIGFEQLMTSLSKLHLPHPALMLVEPGVPAEVFRLADLDATPPREATLVIGPEGGWTPDEIARASDVCRLVSLGGRTLRADAVAVVGVAALFARWQEF
jgi:16S rRNA (uracil1498-N3)-methyltransferase